MTAGRLRVVLGGAGLLLAVVAPVAAPSTTLLPAPQGAAGIALAGAALAAAFGLGFVRPLWSLYVLVALVVLEGAVRKWVVNDITVFLLKDFLALGIYAAVLPRLSRAAWQRPWWLVAPIVGILALAILSAPRSDSLPQVVIGLRAYAIYLPLLWVAPQLLSTRRRAYALVGLTLGLGAVESVLAVAQALSGAGVLNKLVSGAVAGLVTFHGEAFIRPSGTFMQVGALSAFLFFGAIVAFTLILAHRRGVWLWVALGSVALLSWGVVYTSARSLLGSILLAFAATVLALLWRRRFFSVAAVPASFVLGFVFLVSVVPAVRDGANGVAQWWERRGYEQISVTDQTGGTVTLRVDPDRRAELEAALQNAATVPPPAATVPPPAATVPPPAATVPPRETGPLQIAAVDENGNDVVVSVAAGPTGEGPRVVLSMKIKTVKGIDESGKVIDVAVASDGSAAKAGDFLGRAADFSAAGGEVGIWGSRVKPQLDLIRAQRLVGHGTGTMTLGSGYADAGPTVLQGEGMYSKTAWELGLAGLAAFVWLTVALAVASVLGYLRSDGWRRMVAAMAGAATLIMPLWYFFTFALDFPVVGILVYILAGCATAYAQSRRSGPSRASATSEPSPASFPRSAGSN